LLDKRKYCWKCFNFKSHSKLITIATPDDCENYILKMGKCDHQNKIDRFNLVLPDLKKNPEIVGNVQIEILIDTPEHCYYSIKLKKYGKEKIEKSVEIWRSKDKDEAERIKSILSIFAYYWIPIEEMPDIVIEKIEL
jgi:hypothetical protein